MRVSRERETRACSPQLTVEVCNGMDDDCDGEVDNLPPTVCGNSRCAHVVAACTDGQPAQCQPRLERALDTEVCVMVLMMIAMALWMKAYRFSPAVRACQRTVAGCIDGRANVCQAGTAGVEICNGIDDDCDGEIDNGVVVFDFSCVESDDPQCVPSEPEGMNRRPLSAQHRPCLRQKLTGPASIIRGVALTSAVARSVPSARRGGPWSSRIPNMRSSSAVR